MGTANLGIRSKKKERQKQMDNKRGDSNGALRQEYDEQMAQAQSQKGWFHCGIAFWFHPYTVLLILGTSGIFAIGSAAFAAAVSWERDALRMALGETIDIAHKKVLIEGYGYRIVRERATPGRAYFTTELVRNVEAKGKVQRRYESDRFDLAARADAADYKANQLSHTRDYAGKNLDHLDDEEAATLSELEMLD